MWPTGQDLDLDDTGKLLDIAMMCSHTCAETMRNRSAGELYEQVTIRAGDRTTFAQACKLLTHVVRGDAYDQLKATAARVQGVPPHAAQDSDTDVSLSWQERQLLACALDLLAAARPSETDQIRQLRARIGGQA